MSTQPLIDRSQLNPDVTIGLGPSIIGLSGQVLTVVGGVPTWAASATATLAGLTDVSLTAPTNGQVLTYNGTHWVNLTPTNSGTVTSVAATGSTGLVVGGSPITTNGTLTFTLGGELQGLSVVSTNGFVQRTGVGTYTAANLTSVQITTAVPNVSAFTNDAGYISANQTITLTGDVTGSGSTGIATTLATTGVAAGTYNNVTVNVKGLATGGSNIAYLTANQPITISGDASGSGTTSITLTLAASGVTAGTYQGGWGATTVTIPTFTVDATGRITSASAGPLQQYVRTLFTNIAQGEVPASGGGTTNFLRADGTWSTPSTNPGTVTSVAATGSTGLVVGGSPITSSGTLTFTLGTELQGLSGLGSLGIVQRTGVGTYTVANLTSGQVTTALGYTPVPNSTMINTTAPLVGGGALTSSLTLSMPVFGGGVGNGNAGYVPAEGIVTSTKFLRDDGTWQIPPGVLTSVDASGGSTGMSFTGGPITTSGTLTLTGTLAIANGGTGQTTASAAINALVPSQTGQGGNFLTTNGTVVSWASGGGTGVTSFNTRTGAVTLSSVDVTTALGFTPLQNNQVTSLTGDATGSSPGGGNNAIPVTLATVNANVGTFGTSSQVATITVNAKGLITAASNTTITPNAIGAATITGSNASGTWAINISGNAATATTAANAGVTSVFGRTGAVVATASDYSFGQLSGSAAFSQLPAFTHSGDAAGTYVPGSGNVPLTLTTVNGNVGSFTNANITVNAKGLITAASNGAVSGGTVTSVSVTPGTGISASVSSPTTTPNISITNTGVTSIAGTGGQITASAATGAVTLSLPATISVNITGNAATSSNGGVTSITGTASQITASSSTGAITLSLPSSVTISGTMTAAVLNSTSDRKLKKNITKIDNALDIITSLNGVRFDWKKSNLPSAGLIAQEVEQVMPELVSTSEAGTKSMNYNGIIGALVEAMKEMNAIITSLKAEVKALKAK